MGKGPAPQGLGPPLCNLPDFYSLFFLPSSARSTVHGCFIFMEQGHGYHGGFVTKAADYVKQHSLRSL